MIRLIFFTLILFLKFEFAAGQIKCPKGEHWVVAHTRRAYFRADGSFVSATNVKSHCRINPESYKNWSKSFVNKRPKVWGYTKEKSIKWRQDEIVRVLEALSILPEQLLNKSNVKLYRMKKSVHDGNSATTNFHEIVLYDLAFEKKSNLAKILAHEISHILYLEKSGVQKQNYLRVAQWLRLDLGGGKKVYLPHKSRQFVAKDGVVSPDEDFANNLEYFLFDPEKLKLKSSEIYKWIQKTYGKNFKIMRNKK